ncbi:uncharacterized protein LOC132730992 [Ruditapes philippinarum]|uniref:uncharacterized protein LOC132730992 n=1 Tax=Ruditapes philippinarum TaxID=129788 RepID=UPI00295AA310|nr:uncharacterized protein LOC132730992 [Ruditapes philippinarum]
MDITMMSNKAMFLLILLLQFEKAVAIHAEIEELIEQQQQDVVITTEALTKSETQNIVIAKEIFPIQNLDVHGDPGTESVCKYRGECGGSRHGPCPEGSSCENIPGIQVGWCCQTEPQTSKY